MTRNTLSISYNYQWITIHDANVFGREYETRKVDCKIGSMLLVKALTFTRQIVHCPDIYPPSFGIDPFKSTRTSNSSLLQYTRLYFRVSSIITIHGREILTRNDSLVVTHFLDCAVMQLCKFLFCGIHWIFGYRGSRYT